MRHASGRLYLRRLLARELAQLRDLRALETDADIVGEHAEHGDGRDGRADRRPAQARLAHVEAPDGRGPVGYDDQRVAVHRLLPSSPIRPLPELIGLARRPSRDQRHNGAAAADLEFPFRRVAAGP